MTEREYYAKIRRMCADEEDIVAFCERKIDIITRKAQKAKEKAAIENDEITEILRSNLSDEFEPIADILQRIGDEDITVGKAQYRINQLVQAGEAEKTDLVFKEDGVRRTIKGYKRKD